MMNTLHKGVYSFMSVAVLAALAYSPLSPAASGVSQAEIRACAALQFADFSKLEEGEAAANVIKSRFVQSHTMSDEEAGWAYKYSRLMGAPVDKSIKDLPNHCLVEGYVSPTIRFQLRLPARALWNQKYLLNACMGFCGEVSPYPTMAGILREYATMSHDGGHTAYGFDGKWARNNEQLKIDFAYRANHVVAVVAKDIMEKYYHTKAQYSFITGCSKGGHAGVMAAKRYPNDFDGVIARGPTINYTDVNLVNCMDNAKAILDHNDQPILNSLDVAMISQAVMRECDGTDGIIDGVIGDPRVCAFKPTTLQCEAGKTQGCLSENKVAAVEALYAPSLNSQGDVIYGGLPYGSEAEWAGWVAPQISALKPFHYYAATEYLKYIAYPKALDINYDWRDFSYENEQDNLAEVSRFMNADDPDLRAFKQAGGKMLILHGWSDAAIPAYATIDWYEKVEEFMAQNKENVRDFARLFLLPGVVHCGIEGPGPSTFDALAALENWVVGGVAPDSLLTKKEDQTGTVIRTRPVFPYPLAVKYDGKGDINKASSFYADND
ncbi:tannase/feruloyl esterase family alpha/beta hydrolase [Pseudoalteromonas citrea]|uniref:Tannase/feruloyl esterase family alpha/beta hydrolase n=1 Tax=Pseudoalteromonas citrea TaxID=43655 RepID=A0A5S3XIH0_9GAMM|nr:tannase/feruloyl esterase family alpha/beta hydrolase [Pseudoalteromonas citrea]TMP45418.1 tannase/feruloyl esterase family alpha/beta hydrolase [Pseudoalteromonas citrea]TMP53661.1 tannase/feruloyl esterase family alpha/beta hydrolase [Pseudoalteromonas citrea]